MDWPISWEDVKKALENASGSSGVYKVDLVAWGAQYDENYEIVDGLLTPTEEQMTSLFEAAYRGDMIVLFDECVVDGERMPLTYAMVNGGVMGNGIFSGLFGYTNITSGYEFGVEAGMAIIKKRSPTTEVSE